MLVTFIHAYIAHCRTSKSTWCLTSTETVGIIRDGEKAGVWRGYGGGGRGRLYTYRYTVTTRITPALRWAVMRAILMSHWLWWTKSEDSVHRPQFLKRKESRNGFELRSLCLPALPLDQTGSHCRATWIGVVILLKQNSWKRVCTLHWVLPIQNTWVQC